MWAFLRKISVFSLVISVLLGNINCVKAFLLPPGPFTVTGDPLTDVGMVTDYMAQLVREPALCITVVLTLAVILVKYS